MTVKADTKAKSKAIKSKNSQGVKSKSSKSRVSVKPNHSVKMENKEDKKNMIFIRKRVKTPFPTNYLPTIPLKLSAIFRYYEYKSILKATERNQRKERDTETSKYSVLVSYLEEAIENERELLIRSRDSDSRILLFKIAPKFDGVLGKCVKYLSYQDEVRVLTMNSNFNAIGEEPYRLLYVKIKLKG